MAASIEYGDNLSEDEIGFDVSEVEKENSCSGGRRFSDPMQETDNTLAPRDEGRGGDDDELLRSVRVKLDELHAMMRFERTLRKSHGAYHHFLSRLRDAFFVVNEDDMRNLKQILKARWLARRKKMNPLAEEKELEKIVDAAVEARFVENYAWFAHRVRRSIPPPAELEAALRRVVDTFAYVKDATTGLQLFTPKTWVAFKSTIVRIRKGCISDHPDVNYHYLVGTTADGYPMYRCIRGTSPLEGYHHHLRMLVAQSCVSPRLLISLLRCFNYRWNNDMALSTMETFPLFIEVGTTIGSWKKCRRRP